METDPDKINDGERQVEQRLLTEAEGYAASRKRSRAENKIKKESRDRVAEMGFRTDAYQTGIRIIKDLSEGERADFMRDLAIVLRVLGPRQSDLFQEEALKQAKKAERDRVAKLEAEQTARDQAERDKPGSRSDPASGGAGKKGKGKNALTPPSPPAEEKQETGDELIARVSKEEQAKQEQREGEQLLARSPVDNGENSKPKSQSTIAAEKLEAAKLA